MNESRRSPSSLGWRQMSFYGSGDLGLNFFWQGAGFFLLFFYTDVVGLPNALAGAVYAIGGVVDAISDPAMGVIADRTRTKRGRYRPYLLYGAAPLGAAFILLFWAPIAAPAGWLLAAAVVSHVFFRLCYTAVSIPYSALGARLTFDARNRTRLAGIRMIFGALGGLIVIFTASRLRALMPEIPAFLLTSILAGLIGAGLILLAYSRTAERRLSERNASKPSSSGYSIGTLAPLLISNRPFLILTGSLFLLTIANMIVIKTILYRFEYILNASAAGGLAMTLMTAAPLVAIPSWVLVYLKLDKRPAFLLGCGIVISGLIMLYFWGEHNIGAAIFTYVYIATGFSAFAVGFWSILPDTIDYGHWNSGRRVESGLVGLASAIQKIAIALAGLGVGVALDIFNYKAGVVQQPETLSALHQFSTLAPAALMAFSALLFLRYPISAEKHAGIVKALKA